MRKHTHTFLTGQYRHPQLSNGVATGTQKLSGLRVYACRKFWP
ncbi:hypothetical protein BN938_0201 [Mucinivorans hirudinis]|uniref:Uncharacterized protein n=1 Tax=Mucinivorans hirudinis TaxID=1433126 RepID=A0A060R611_9BACT|nr:hypothetical protein BN938_0201 [Mucinivorans hirudinis]